MVAISTYIIALDLHRILAYLLMSYDRTKLRLVERQSRLTREARRVPIQCLQGCPQHEDERKLHKHGRRNGAADKSFGITL